MLELKNIKKAYGKTLALDNFTLNIEDGMLYGLVGPNGAGKTTIMKIIAGLMRPDSGSIRIGGISPSDDIDRIKELIGYVPDSFGFYDNLKIGEYMEFFAEGYGLTGLSARKRCAELLAQVGLEDRVDSYVDSLSRGMQQRLCLARALIHDPAFIVMDEPSSGLDPRTRYEFKEMIMQLNFSGKTVLISSHILSELAQMCTDIGIMENGRMVMSGSMEDIMSRIEVSNPIKINVLDGVNDALTILKRNPCVQTISVNGHAMLINFEGNREDEAVLLQQLIDADIPVREFAREPGSLENYFMQITGHTEEKVITRNDY